jgi:hypothetical protein
MASETNELTFVRCPTCRSLVPASASRCRICNATLEAGAKAASSEPQAPQGRARQKTVSAAAEEVRNIVASSTPSEPPARPAPAAPAQPLESASPAASKSVSDDDTFDPLGAFLQDLDADEAKPSPSAPPAPQKTTPAVTGRFEDDDDDDDDDSEDDDEDFDLDIFDDPVFEELLSDKASESSAQASDSDESDASAILDELTGLLDDVEDDEPQAEVKAEPPPVIESESPRRDAPRQAPTRDVAPPPRARETLSREEPRAARPAERRPEPRPKVETPAPAVAPRPRIGGVGPRPEVKPRVSPEPTQNDRGNARQQRPVQPEVRGTERREDPRLPEGRPTINSAREMASSNRGNFEGERERAQVIEPAREERPSVAPSGPRPTKMKPGRLFGWLVSYENPDGRAIELRVGRFFITGNSIRGSDLILEDQSISTPHALVAITENGFQLQDLMSERGTFVRQQGEAQYSREDGVMQIRHGDWIRFGDVEFLVTIVPS